MGRLDKESDGLILLTNDGDMMDRLLRSVNGHEKEYIVSVNKPINKEFIKRMSGGIYLKELDRTTRKCVVEKISDKTFRIILTQGLNRQKTRIYTKRKTAKSALKIYEDWNLYQRPVK